ncbi:MAG TPA: hypothetical protein VK756_01005 [Solirubrobacteraceae bacterium]|jgi:hypothetical protein|nr:hypothetical protein [Solirubrobacteraceae bacterium]
MFKAKIVLTAFAATLALSALVATAASAAEAGWMVNKAQLSGSAAFASTAKVTPGNLTAANGINVRCNGTKIEGSGEIISPTKAKGQLTFQECQSENENCTLASPKIGTLPLLLTEITLDGTLAVRGHIEGETKTFATFKYEGSSCSLAGVNTIAGKVEFLAPEGQDERTFQEVLVSALPGELRFLGSEGKLHFTALLALKSGQAWSFL